MHVDSERQVVAVGSPFARSQHEAELRRVAQVVAKQTHRHLFTKNKKNWPRVVKQIDRLSSKFKYSFHMFLFPVTFPCPIQSRTYLKTDIIFLLIGPFSSFLFSQIDKNEAIAYGCVGHDDGDTFLVIGDALIGVFHAKACDKCWSDIRRNIRSRLHGDCRRRRHGTVWVRKY